MRDAGHDESDELLKKMQAEIEDVYRTAQKDLQKKIDDYVGKFAKDDAKKQKLVANGKMSQEDYEAWKQKTMLTGKQYRQMLDTVSADLTNADKIARSIINGYTPEVYAVGMNYGTYQIESGTTFNTNFTLYNRETVERLLRDDPQLLPMPKVNIPKDKAWNYRHIKSAVTQGIIQGESMPKIAKRLENVVGMDKRAAIRNARTSVTGAENAGRMDSFQRAKEMGIGVKKQWLATPDGRTRDSHVEIDLEVVELEENFSNGCEYPGDPGGDPAEVYNCRCAMIPWLDRFGDKFDGERMMNLHGMTYDEWKGSKNAEPHYTEKESQSLQDYSRSYYSGINNLLRGDSDFESIDAREIIDGIDSAMKKTTTSKQIAVFRGASERDLTGMFMDETRSKKWFEKIENLHSLEGETATFSSYLSTSVGGLQKQFSHGVEWEFVADKGCHAIDMSHFSVQKDENEILFARNSKIEIIKIDAPADSDGDVIGIIKIVARIVK